MNGERRMDKKGDIPTIVLVIGVFIVCSLALGSFYVSNFKVEKSFVGIGAMEEMNSQIEENFFSGENVDGFYIEKNETKWDFEWGFNWRKEVMVFSVEYEP